MIKTIIFDFSRVLLFPMDDNYSSSLNGLNDELSERFGENYNFFEYFKLNDEILEKIKELKEKDLTFYIFTTDKIQDKPEVQEKIGNLFEKIFRAKELGILKTEPKAYLSLIHEIGCSDSEVIYIDDTEANIEAAKSVDLNTIKYVNNKQLFSEMEQFINNSLTR